MRLTRLLRTARHLRAGQVSSRLYFALERRLVDPSGFAARLAVPPFDGCRGRPRLPFLPPGPQNNSAADVLSGWLTFLNERREVGWPPRWDLPAPKLWQYNLHYFEYLWALSYEQAKQLTSNWIDRHPLRRGSVGWEPYPLSLRLMNWCGYFFHRREVDLDSLFTAKLWPSIFCQAEWLRRHLETHLLGNHLLENVLALATVGACFRGASAERWRSAGEALLARELPEQVLPDGGHFERSPMYQLRVVYGLAMLHNIHPGCAAGAVEAALLRSVRALPALCHPDGQIALFNDSACGIYNTPAELFRYAAELLSATEPQSGPALLPLPQTGYFADTGIDQSFVICDAGPIGPDYQPGHAHGDLLSFELSLGGHRVVVDSGVHDYVQGAMRQYCRSTAAHNTVEVNAQDQCEFWGAFRVARRGRPRDVKWQRTADGFCLSAWHTGYQRLRGRPRHWREFVWSRRGVLNVRDVIKASVPVSAVSRIHLHPTCAAEKVSDDVVRVRFPGGSFTISFAGPGALSLEPSWYCPEFNTQIANTMLVFAGTARKHWEASFSICYEKEADRQC